MQTIPFDAAKYLDTQEAQDLYLKEVAKEKNLELMFLALQTVAKARGDALPSKDFEEMNLYLKPLGFRLTLEAC